MAEKRELARLLHRFRPQPQPPISLAPGCPFGAVVEEKLRGLEKGQRELRGRLHWLLFWMSGAVMAEVLLRLLR